MKPEDAEFLEEFLELRHPRAIRAFERYRDYKWEDLKPGTVLMMLRAGFSGSAGAWRKVTRIEGDLAFLTSLNDDGSSVLMRESAPGDWRKEFWTDVAYIVTEEDILVRNGEGEHGKTVNTRRWYFRDKVGMEELTYQ